MFSFDGDGGMSSWHSYTTIEDLPENLRECVVDHGSFTFFHHPLHVCMFPMLLPVPIEDIIEKKRAYITDCGEAGHYHGMVFAHERPYRYDALVRLREADMFRSDDPAKQLRLSVKFWNLVRAVWVDSENFDPSDHWEDMVESDVPHRGFMTHTEDRRKLRDMPDMLTVYRGIRVPVDSEDMDYDVEEVGLGGMSWTLDEWRAKFFAKRYGRPDLASIVVTATIPKDSVVAYINDRSEDEIILMPHAVIDYDYEVL
jgi:hypothetical protein